MNRRTKDKLILTLLAVFLAAFLVSIVLGALLDIRYFMVSVGIAILILSKMPLHNHRKQESDNLLFQNTLADCPGGKPHFHCGSSYGWPTYAVTFASVELMELAIMQGNIENFKSALAELHRGTAFRPSLAVTVTAIGQIRIIESTLANGEKRNLKFLTEGVNRDGQPRCAILQPEQERER